MKSHQGDMSLKHKQPTQVTLSFSSLCSIESPCLYSPLIALLSFLSPMGTAVWILCYIHIVLSIKLRCIDLWRLFSEII